MLCTTGFDILLMASFCCLFSSTGNHILLKFLTGDAVSHLVYNGTVISLPWNFDNSHGTRQLYIVGLKILLVVECVVCAHY